MATTFTTHRQPLEYLGGVRRFPVPEDKTPWSVDYPGYHPVDYTAPRVLSRPVWADPDIRSLMRHSSQSFLLQLGAKQPHPTFVFPQNLLYSHKLCVYLQEGGGAGKTAAVQLIGR